MNHEINKAHARVCVINKNDSIRGLCWYVYGSLDGALEKEPRGCVHVPAGLVKRFVNDSLRKPQSEQRRHLAFSRIQLFLAARFRVQADHVFFRYTDLAAQLKLKIDELVVCVCV